MGKKEESSFFSDVLRSIVVVRFSEIRADSDRMSQ
jgi:hypothetical protein